MSDIVLYTSGHGFGHAVRDAELLRAIGRLAPELKLQVRTSAPRWLFPETVEVLDRRIDLGVVQSDGYRMRVGETLDRYSSMIEAEPLLIQSEASELHRGGARAVLADIPSAAFPIARSLGIPGIGVANFSWDWIYAEFIRKSPRHAPLVDHQRSQYAQADLLLRLPLHSGLTSFRSVVDVPLIARLARDKPGAVRRRLGLPFEAPLILLTFGGFDYDGFDFEKLKLMRELAFVLAPPVGQTRRDANVFTVAQEPTSFVDLLAACDAVVTKPGYGIAADCIANRVPMVYSLRGGFREEPALTRELRRLGRAVAMPRSALRRWDLRPYLERLLSMDRAWPDVRVDGADVAAGHILKRI